MLRNRAWVRVVAMGAAFCAAVSLRATETENYNIRVLPAPGKVAVDGRADDWDLSGGIFACGDVENARDQYAVWLHAMYDADNVYILARWIDQTPMNNPGSIKGDYGFRGDCLQVRFVTAPDVNGPDVLRRGNQDNDAPGVRTSHWDCWRDRDGLDKLGCSYGRRFNEGSGDAKAHGGAQAFLKNEDGHGYAQEIAFPWKVLTRDGSNLKVGDRMLMTFEPNFLLGGLGRLTIKDGFRPGAGVDRVFTFRAYACWATASLEPKGRVAPASVRLSDGREFAVRMEAGLPVIDWTGLIKSRELIGFKPIRFSMPDDGYVSLNLYSASNTVARQLLTCAFYTKGEHEVAWDGLRTWSWRQPGEPVAAGDYTWRGIYHKGLGLRLKGWACNGVAAPWDGPADLDAWGGDHGDPCAAAADTNQVYLGWESAEGGKALVACDLKGFTRWRQTRGGIGSASLIAADAGYVYVVNRAGQYAPVGIYKLDAKRGGYADWTSIKSTDLLSKHIWGDVPGIPGSPSGLAARNGKVFASYGSTNAVAVIDATTGEVLRKLAVPSPGDLEASADGSKLFVLSKGRQVLEVDVGSGATRTAVEVRPTGTNDWATSLAIDKAGSLYVGVYNGDSNVRVYSVDGKLQRAIGRKGGRPLLGKWQPDGMMNVVGLAVDAAGKLWVAEGDGQPRRFSLWDTQTGAFEKEFFGASGYGAGGGAVDPVDPSLMVGQGCEWRLDSKSGRASCVQVITRISMGNSRFGLGKDGRLYLAITPGSLHGQHPVSIFEKVADGRYKLRTVLRPGNAKEKQPITVWADRNGDEREQPEEVASYDVSLGGWITGWYMPMAPDLSFYGTLYRMKVTGYTACGAPEYDLSQAVKITDDPKAGSGGGYAGRGLGCTDGSRMLLNCSYGADYSQFTCCEVGTGRTLWTYPSNFTGVHGSHRAPGPEVGLIRGSFDIVGTAKLPAPVGCIWTIPTNKGEWHILTEDGYYLSKIFEGDLMKMAYPDKAEPGAILDRCPPGAPEEAFGGSMTLGQDGKLYCQVGHTGFWNVEVTGLENIKALPSTGKVVISAEDTRTAQALRGKALQDSVGTKRLVAKRLTPVFSGDLARDFNGTEIVSYQKNDGAGVRTAVAWDGTNLYVGWEVKDDTPWVNGADAPEFMYARGDTVDLQLAANPRAKKDRAEAEDGDLRLSIGAFQGAPTAVLYRRVAGQKNSKTFNSGVIKGYVMESVTVEPGVKVEVKAEAKKKQYVAQATIPLATLGLVPADGLIVRGDLGATHGNAAGNDTLLRTYWNNQSAGIVSDEVFELKMEPKNWGEFKFSDR